MIKSDLTLAQALDYIKSRAAADLINPDTLGLIDTARIQMTTWPMRSRTLRDDTSYDHDVEYETAVDNSRLEQNADALFDLWLTNISRSINDKIHQLFEAWKLESNAGVASIPEYPIFGDLQGKTVLEASGDMYIDLVSKPIFSVEVNEELLRAIENGDENPSYQHGRCVYKIRFFKYVSDSNISNWEVAYADLTRPWNNSEENPYHLTMSTSNAWRIDYTRGEMIPQRMFRNNRKIHECPNCLGIVKYNTETVPALINSWGRRQRICVACVITARFYDVEQKVFHLVPPANYEHALSSDITFTRSQDYIRRNIENQIPGWEFVQLAGFRPLELNTRRNEYGDQLTWYYWDYINGAYQATRVSNDSLLLKHRTQSSSKLAAHNYVKENLPIGMELEVNYRTAKYSDLNASIQDILQVMHENYPYGQRVAQSSQLALATYDSSLDSGTGMEFKFQPMTVKFLETLPDTFWTALNEGFRGQTLSANGIHMSIPAVAFESASILCFSQFFNRLVQDWRLGYQPRYVLGEILGRVNAGYAKWNIAGSSRPLPSVYDGDLDIECAKASYQTTFWSNRNGRSSLLNFGKNYRVEVRGFASANHKELIMKNYDFLTAVFQYARVQASLFDSTFDDEKNSFNDAIGSDENLMVMRLTNNPYTFFEWVMDERNVDKFPHLTTWINDANILTYLRKQGLTSPSSNIEQEYVSRLLA